MAETTEPKQADATPKTSELPLLVRITRADKQKAAATLLKR